MQAENVAARVCVLLANRGTAVYGSWPMKMISVLITVVAVLFSSFVAAHAADAAKAKKTKLRHVVAFKFKEGTTPDQIKKVEDAFAALPKKISQVNKFEWGTNNSPEKRNKGCTHCFILTFKTEKARDAYLFIPRTRTSVIWSDH
jgi:hypothetical protein